jgi:hypothetical protein
MLNLKTNIDMSTNDELKNETANGTKPVLAVRACEGSCEVHKGEVVPVIIEGHGWDGR